MRVVIDPDPTLDKIMDPHPTSKTMDIFFLKYLIIKISITEVFIYSNKSFAEF